MTWSVGTHQLVDGDGRPVAEFTNIGRPEPNRYDMLRSLTSDADLAALVVRSELADCLVSCVDEPLIDALMAQGALEARRAAHMGVDLRGFPSDWLTPHLPEGVVTRAMTTADGELIGRLEYLAYPPGHVDNVRRASTPIDDLIRAAYDRLVIPTRPLLPEATLAIAGDRAVGVVTVQGDTRPGLAGPWLTNVCRDPDPSYQGLGEAMIKSVLARLSAKAYQRAYLGVTAGNPARRVYERVGFVEIEPVSLLRIPGWRP